MKDKQSADDWFPLWVDKWLFGSTRIELDPAERSVWIDLMALAAKDRGHIRANETVPYAPEQLAGFLCVPLDLLHHTVAKCLSPEISKLQRLDNGTLYVVNWQEYELSKRHKRRVMSEKVDIVSEKEDTKSRVEESRIEKKRVEKDSKPLPISKRPLPEIIDYLQKAYTWVNLKTEVIKMTAWLAGRPRRKLTYSFMVNWLNKIEKPILETPASPKTKGTIQTPTYPNRTMTPEEYENGAARAKEIVDSLTKKIGTTKKDAASVSIKNTVPKPL